MAARRALRTLALLLVTIALGAVPARATEPTSAGIQTPPPARNYFYDPTADYGVQALYSPLYVLVNRGFDIVQAEAGRRQIFRYPWGPNLRNVADNVLHFPSRVSEYGWGNFLKEEILPLTWSTQNARWVPNYSLHLVGGGMTYRMLREWFEDKGVPLGWLWSSAVVMVSAFINEALENSGSTGRNTDSIADIVFFDLGGILLFSWDLVPRLFSRYLHLADWSLQPAFTLPEGRLHNVGNYFALRIDIHDPVSFFGYFGNGTWAGISWRVHGEERVSLAGGVFNSRLVGSIEHKTQLNSVVLTSTAGIFWDRNGTPLASLIFRDVFDQRFALNIYPGVILPGKWSPGVWAVAARDGSFAFGVSAGFGFGVGIGVESPGMRALDP